MIIFVKVKFLLNVSGKKLLKGGLNIIKYLIVGLGVRRNGRDKVIFWFVERLVIVGLVDWFCKEGILRRSYRV